jgi:hypothetical protein
LTIENREATNVKMNPLKYNDVSAEALLDHVVNTLALISNKTPREVEEDAVFLPLDVCEPPVRVIEDGRHG